MVSRIPVVSAASVLLLVVALTGCVTSAEPEANPTATVSPSETPTPTTETEPQVALPTCETMFSADMVATLAADGLVLQPDNLFGGPSTFDGVLNLLNSLSESVTCTWILPNSDLIVTASVATVNSSERTQLDGVLTSEGFTVSEALTGSLYMFEYTGEGTYLREAHLVLDALSFSAQGSSGREDQLTLDAAEQLLQ